MPLSSTDISNLIAGQQASFANSAVFAQGIGSGGQASAISAAPVQDPRAPSPGLAGAVGSAPDMAMGGVAMMAAFGLAPRALDPFTSTFAAGAKGLAGGGMAGAIGRAGMTGGAYMAGGAALNAVAFDPFAQGAQTRGMMNQFAGGLMPGANANQRGQISSTVEGMNQQGYGTLNELTSLMSQGVGSGEISTTSVSEFKASFQKMVTTAREVATALNSSVTEGNAALQSIKAMGLSTDQSSAVIGAIGGVGRASGMSPAQLTESAMGGIQMAQSLGGDVVEGAQGAVFNRSLLGTGRKMGGVYDDVSDQQYGKFQQGAMRFLGSRQGSQVLAASYDTQTGALNMDIAGRIAGGQMSKEAIASAASKTMASSRDDFASRRTELASSYMSQFGAQGIANPLREMTSGSMQQTQMQAISGMGRRDLQALDQLSNQTPMLRANLMRAAQEGWNEGQHQATTIGGALSSTMDALTRPLKDKFRRMGRDMAQSVMEAQEKATSLFVGSPPKRADPQYFQMKFRAAAMGDAHAGGVIDDFEAQRGPMPGPNQSNAFGFGRGGSQAQRQWIPPALRMQTMGAGAQFSELPMYGMAMEEHNPYMSAGAGVMAGGAMIRGMTGGHGPLGAPGAGIERLGRGMRAMAGPQQGFMGFAGRGWRGGAAAGAGALTQAGGFMAKHAGRLATNKYVAGAALVGVGLSNMLPAALRATGYMDEVPEVTGHNKRLLGMLQDQNLIDMPEYQKDSEMASVGSMGGKNRGLTAGIASRVQELARQTPDEGTIRALGGESGVRRTVNLMHSSGMEQNDMMDYLTNVKGLHGEEAFAVLRQSGAVEGVVGAIGRGEDPENRTKALQGRIKELTRDPDKLRRFGVGGGKGVHKKALEMMGESLEQNSALAELAFEMEAGPNPASRANYGARMKRFHALLSSQFGGADNSKTVAYLASTLAAGNTGATTDESLPGGDAEMASDTGGADRSALGNDSLVKRLVRVGASSMARDSQGYRDNLTKMLKDERANTVSLARLAGTASGGRTGLLEHFLGNQTVDSLNNNTEFGRNLRGQLDDAGLDSPDQMDDFAAMMAGSNTEVGRRTAISTYNTSRTRRAMKKGGGNAEKFIEGLVGDINGKLNKEQLAFFKGDGPMHATTEAFMRQAASRLVDSGDEPAMRRMTQRLIDSASAYVQKDNRGAEDVADHLSGYSPPHVEGGNRSGALIEQMPDFQKALNGVISGLRSLNEELRGMSLPESQ